jgi:hypothetical protein
MSHDVVHLPGDPLPVGEGVGSADGGALRLLVRRGLRGTGLRLVFEGPPFAGRPDLVGKRPR